MSKKTKYTEDLEESCPSDAHLEDSTAGQVWSYKKKQPVKAFGQDCKDSSILPLSDLKSHYHILSTVGRSFSGTIRSPGEFIEMETEMNLNGA